LRRNAGSSSACMSIPVKYRQRSRRGMPALPYWSVTLNADKPRSSAYPKTLETLGDHIRAVRLDRGLLQRQIAQQIGVSKATIHNWELNWRQPTLPQIQRVLKFLGYDPLPAARSLSERVLLMRKRRGITQKQLAKRLGLDQTTLGKLERGIRKPCLATLQRINHFLDTESPDSKDQE